MEDDFFEQFRQKDLSKVKKFNFKKAKEAKSPEKPPFPPLNVSKDKGSLVYPNTSRISLTNHSNNNDSRQHFTFKKQEATTSYRFSCCESENIPSSTLNGTVSSPRKKFTFKRTDNDKATDVMPNSIGKGGSAAIGSLQTPSKKFQFKRKDEVGANSLSTAKHDSPSKNNRTDNILDSLYKSTLLNDVSPSKIQTSNKNSVPQQSQPQKLSLSLKKNISNPNSLQVSPSLLSGRPKLTSKGTFNISKYFGNENKTDHPKVDGISPLKKLLVSKQVESTSTSVVSNSKKGSECKKDSDKVIAVSTSSSSNDSPIIRPKKFVFKKKIVSSSTSSSLDQSEGGFDLDNILGSHPVPNKEPLSNNKCTDFVTKAYKTNRDFNIDNDHQEVTTTTKDNLFNNVDAKDKTENFVNESFEGLMSNSESVTNTQTLEINDGDYMDDEEFERMFGGLAEQFADSIPSSTTDVASTSKSNEEPRKKTSKEPDSQHDTDELLNEISNINWDENEFEDEPIQEGFKDRLDDSAEFRGQYDHSEVMLEVLNQKFGLRHFRPHQREIINASLTQHDCFVLMPTGGGKSLCYQLPAILMPGVTIVISPLRALISDQVDKLNALDIAAAHLCSDVSKVDSDLIYMKLSMREPAIKLLYLTPEKISASRVITDMLDSLYQRSKLARFVIDEVHCLSQWGHDFRPDYKQLGMLRKNYKDVPIICLTATATKQVENDVINILHLKTVKRFIRSFNRPNIKYEVVDKKGKATDAIANLIRTKFPKKSGIVYCLGRKECDDLADDFNKVGVKAKPYHAGMNDKVREVIQREWMQDRFHVIVATIAFGMGIDKPDVRFVIHNSIPKSVEAFYQESGRAGRDGEVSYSYLYYSYRDVSRLQKLIKLDRNMTKKTLDAHFENLKQMVGFAENVVDCRRYLQLIHLGEHFDRRICIQNKATTCDNCENIDKYKSLEVTREAKELCTIVKDLTAKENVTMLHVADVYRGAKIKKILDRRHNQHRFYGAGASMNKNDVERVLKELILKQVLQDFCTYTGDFPVVYIKAGLKFYQFYNSNYRLVISVLTDKKRLRVMEPVAQPETVVDDSGRGISKASSSGWVGAPKATTSKEVVRHTVQKQQTAKLQAARKLQLSQLKVQCHEELLEECRRLAMERNLTLSSVMNLSAIKSMSDHLPATKEEMLKIQHVTVANYNKYGDYFLKITQKFREKHDALQPLTEVKRDFCDDEGEDFYQSDSQMFSSSQPQTKGRGVKRKGGWGGKKGGYKKKKTYYKKKKAKKASPKAVKAASSGWKGKGGGKGRGGGGLGLMPLHIK